MERIIPFRKISITPELTDAQKKFWKLLQEEANRALPVIKLCEKAGYRTKTPWYDAIRDETFRTKIEAIGVPIQRAVTYKGKIELAQDAEEEWAKDIIDMRRLVADYPKHMGAGHFRLNFCCIRNPGLRNLTKRYFRAHISFWDASTFQSVLKALKPFFFALGNRYPEMVSFVSLTREMIEPLLTLPTWIDSRGYIHAISIHKKHRMLICLGGMFSYLQRHGWEEAPRHVLIYEEDRPKLPKRRPRPLPQYVFEQLQVHAQLLPSYARNLVEILSVAGLRAEDAMHLPDDCLEYDAAGDPRLQWYNRKMKRDGRPLPVTTAVAEAVQRQRDLVKSIPDVYEERYLFRTDSGLYRFEVFIKHLNRAAREIPILGEDGHIYHFKPHAFRHMVGTSMINNGMGIADVMAYLDHESAEMSLQYAEIDDGKLKQKFKALVLSGQAIGGAALKALREQLEKGDESELDWVVSNLRKLSLPWGQCLHHAKANKCPYGQNACFTKDNGPCHKLVTTPEHAPVIIATMEDLKRSKQIADEKGWEMYANDLMNQIDGMQQVLTELQVPADQRAKNRGGAK